MSRYTTMRRGALALALSLSLLALSVGQVVASGGFPPFPK